MFIFNVVGSQPDANREDRTEPSLQGCWRPGNNLYGFFVMTLRTKRMACTICPGRLTADSNDLRFPVLREETVDLLDVDS